MQMNLRQDGLVVPASGTDYVPVGLSDLTVMEPGGKCVHGNYIPSNQVEQDYSESCHLCMSLKAFCSYTGLTPEQADRRVYYWVNYEHEEAKKLILEQWATLGTF